MVTKTLWAAESGATLLLAELNNMADLATVVDGADYDNATNKYRYADYLFFGTFDAACTAGAFVELHQFWKLDGTNYGDGEDGDVGAPIVSGNSLVGVFNIGTEAGPMYQQIVGVPLSPFAVRHAIKLNTGQALTAVDTHFVKIYPYNEEFQA